MSGGRMDIYDKSFEMLKKIVANQKKFGYRICLIGGWAVWIYNPYMKSRDIDFIIESKNIWKFENFIKISGFRETAAVLEKRGYSMLLDDDKIELDVYDKKIGKCDVGQFIENSVMKRIDGLKVNAVSVSDLFLLKSNSAMERLGSAKGEKDLSDILALLDRHYRNIRISDEISTRKIFSIILKDFRQASLLYPLSYERFGKIKVHFKKMMK